MKVFMSFAFLYFHTYAALGGQAACPASCKTCKAGASHDGGKPINSNGFCEHFCSKTGYCGNGNAYKTGDDCSGCITSECLPTDSDECLENTPKWGPGKDCAYAKKYCDTWAKDARRCCPETCKTGALTEDQCKALNSQGTCIYPLKNQCTSRVCFKWNDKSWEGEAPVNPVLSECGLTTCISCDEEIQQSLTQKKATCPTVKVLTTVTSLSSTGDYFGFSKEDFSKMVGTEDWSGQSFEIVQEGSHSWKGNISVWNRTTLGGPIAKKSIWRADGDWKEGDTITLKSCLESVNGGWREGDFAQCECVEGTNEGTQKKYKYCDNPKPIPPGKDCSCNKDDKDNSKEIFCNGTIAIIQRPCKCPVNGGWRYDEKFGKCSKNCGPGKKTKQIYCDNPSPKSGGSICPCTVPGKALTDCNGLKANLVEDCNEFVCPECEPTDSDECLANTPKWGPGKDCAYANSYCNSWAKDAKRCCPKTCGTGLLTEPNCNALDSKGTCIYPLKNQCPKGECLPTDSDECLANTPQWGPTKDCAYAKKYCDTWAKDARRCCPETCKTGVLTEDQCKALNSKGTCIYPLKNQCTNRGYSCPTVNIEHTNHPKSGDTGKYFFFSKDEFSKMAGVEDWNGMGEEFEVYQEGSHSWKGKVMVWATLDGKPNPHGRKSEGSADGDWKKLDAIAFSSCGKPEMCTGNFMELDIKNANNGKQRPPPGTKCVGGCIQKSGRWGETSCYTEADESQWGAECMACIVTPTPSGEVTPELREYISLEVEKKECDGSKVQFGDGDVLSLIECANGCSMMKASMFIFGTNDFGEKKCNEGGKKGCRCYCETSAKAGECNQMDHNGYRLYKFVGKGVNCGYNSVAKNCTGECMWSNNKCIHLNVTKDSAVQCWGYKGAACSDCQESMAEHGEWQNDDCVCADYECNAACKCDLRGTQPSSINIPYCFYKETPCKNVKGELITEEYLKKTQGEKKRRIWYSNCERGGDTLMNCPEKSFCQNKLEDSGCAERWYYCDDRKEVLKKDESWKTYNPWMKKNCKVTCGYCPKVCKSWSDCPTTMPFCIEGFCEECQEDFDCKTTAKEVGRAKTSYICDKKTRGKGRCKAIVDCKWEEKSSTICSASCGYGGVKIVLKTKIVEESENGYCEKPGPVGTVRNFVEDCFLTECPAICDCGFFPGCEDPYSMSNCGAGCRITQAPPGGSKCSCSITITSVLGGDWCDGTAVKCNSYEDPGCHGCKDKECCLGNCVGYGFNYINEMENVQTPMFGG